MLNRQLLVTKIDPSWKVASGRDFVAGELGIAENADAYFAFNTVALRAEQAATSQCRVCGAQETTQVPPEATDNVPLNTIVF